MDTDYGQHVSLLLQRLSQVTGFQPERRGEGWKARCPVPGHGQGRGDQNPSLDIDLGKDRQVLLKCWAGCKVEDIVRALGLEMRDLFPSGKGGDGRRRGKIPRGHGLTLPALAEAKKLPVEFLQKHGVQQAHALKTTDEGSPTVLQELCGEQEWGAALGRGERWWPEVLFRYSLEDGSPAPRHRRRFSLAGPSKFCWTGRKDDGAIVPYGLPYLKEARDAGRIFLVEGETDLLTLKYHGISALGVPGASMAKVLRRAHFHGVQKVYVVREPDQGGKEFVESIRQKFASWRSWEGKLHVLELKGAKDSSELHCKSPEGFDAAFQEAVDAAKLVDVEACRSTQNRRQAGSGGGECGDSDALPAAGGGITDADGEPRKPTISLNALDLDDLTRQAIGALERANEPPVLFVRNGALCRVVHDEHGRPRIEEMTKQKMRLRLAQVALFAVTTESGERLKAPPDQLVESVLSLAHWPFPPLAAISAAPILRPDGTICSEPGYDRETAIYYIPEVGLEVPAIPEHPTTEQTQPALDELLDLLVDFRFADEASRANALAILLSVVMRPVISGCIPMALIDAPLQGTGKTLLASVIGTIAQGSLPIHAAPARNDDSEMRKKVSTVLLDGSPIVLIDNLPETDVLGSPILAAVLTSPEWADRRLGKNETIRVPARTVWIATGNNVRVAGDMPRRCYTIRLDANEEQPWKREGFTYPNIMEHTRTHRGRLLAATLTLILSWYAAGKPRAPNVPPFGSFEEFAEVVGGVLAHAGVKGFLQNADAVRAVQDEETAKWRAFFAAWWEAMGARPVTVAELCEDPLVADFLSSDALPDCLLAAREKVGGSLKRSLGKALSRLAGRIFEGRKLEAAGVDTTSKVRRWRLRDAAGFGGSDGVSQQPHARREENESADHMSRTKQCAENPANAAHPAAPVADRQPEEAKQVCDGGGHALPAVEPTDTQPDLPHCRKWLGHHNLWRRRGMKGWLCDLCNPRGDIPEAEIERARWDPESRCVVGLKCLEEAAAT